MLRTSACHVVCVLLVCCGGRTPEAQEAILQQQGPASDAEKSPAFGLVPIGPDEADPLVFDAMKLAEQGRTDEAVAILQEHLEAVPNALYARLGLADILRAEARLDECAEVLKDGLSGFEHDYMIWMAIAEIRLQQAEDGPNMIQKGGMIIFTPNKNPDVDEEAYRQEHLELAVTALENAFKIKPESKLTIAMLASAKTDQGDLDGAIELFERLSILTPDSCLVLTELAKTLVMAGRDEDAYLVARQALDVDPRSPDAHFILGKLYGAKGDDEKEALYEKKAGFYVWMAPFTTIEYKDEHWDLYQLITGQTGASAADILKQTETLAKTDTRVARDILSTIAWNHMHGAMDLLAFEKLTEWKAQEELFGLVEHAGSTCTLRMAYKALATLKAPGVFEILVEALPEDTRGAHPMNVAEALDILGDPRAVPHLIEVLNPSFVEEKELESIHDILMLSGHDDARVRAALALGAFDTEESREALTIGTAHPRLGAACHAALYRLTGSKEHRDALLEAAASGDRYGYLIEDYLVRMGTEESLELAKEWK